MLWLRMAAVSEWCGGLVTALAIQVLLVLWLHGFGALQWRRMASNGGAMWDGSGCWE